MNIEEAHKDSVLKNLLFGVETILSSAWSGLFINEYSEAQIEGVNLIYRSDLIIGFEVVFSTPPNISMFADVFKVTNDAAFPEVNNLFRILPTSLAMNRFFGIHQLNHLGIDIFDNNNNVLSISNSNGSIYKAKQPISIPSGFTIKKLKLYFVNSTTFVNPAIIVRILGLFIPDFMSLLLTAYKRELQSFTLQNPNAVPNYVMPNLFGLLDFIQYSENLPELEAIDSKRQRSIFIRSVFISEFSQIKANHINLDMGSKVLYVNKQNYSEL